MKTVIVLLTLFIPACCFSFEIDPYQKSEESCFNLVLCPLNYSAKSDFSGDLEQITTRLKKTLPFSEFADKINIYIIGISKEEQGLFFREAQGFPPLAIRQDLLQNIEKSLKSAYKLVIIDAKGGVSCAELSEINKVSVLIIGRSRYANNNSFAKGFLHELGHSLGLRDECLDCSQLSAPGFPNCAVNKTEALKYWGDLTGKDNGVNFIAGCCGNRRYIRATLTSLMNDAEKAEDFGPVNERYLRQVLTK